MSDIPDTMQAALLAAARPRWWCLRSKMTGQLILDGRDDAGQMVGHVMTFWDRREAEAWGAAHRESYPKLLIEAVPLPDAPPERSTWDDHDGHVASHQLSIARGDEAVWVEVRPDAGGNAPGLISLVGKVLRKLGTREDLGPIRVGPELIVRLGTRRHPPSPDQEAA